MTEQEVRTALWAYSQPLPQTVAQENSTAVLAAWKLSLNDPGLSKLRTGADPVTVAGTGTGKAGEISAEADGDEKKAKKGPKGPRPQG